MYISDMVSISEIKRWKEGDAITIKAGTGKGKSFFIKNDLYNHAKEEGKRILMLIHRKNCVDQFKMEIEADNKLKERVIDIKTYQSIEASERMGNKFDFDDYDYIICDEFHYFMSDASFNVYTDLSLSVILEAEATKIFMSATGDSMKEILESMVKETTLDYEIPIDFEFIRKLEFFYKESTMDCYAKRAIENNEKFVFFIQSAKEAYELYSKYKEHSIFNCGKSSKMYKHVNEEEIEDMLRNEGFDKTNEDGLKDSTEGKLLLFTTAVMDAGVNLVMDDLKNIVCDIDDTGSLIQCIGRKRLKGEGDYINLYIRMITNQQLGGMETQIKKRLELADYFIENGEKMLVRENYRSLNDTMIYDEPSTELGDGSESRKRLNSLMYFRAKATLEEIMKIKKYEVGYSYAMHMTHNVFNLEEFSMYEADEKERDLREFLSRIEEQKLYKSEQNELIEKVDLRVNGRRQRSYRKLNEGLEMISVEYVIVPKKSGSSRFWVVYRKDE